MPTVVRFDTVPLTPWKNGGGVTRELWREPAEGPIRLRLSVAEVRGNGPFSFFPDLDRVLLILTGNGVALSGPEGRVTLGRQSAPFVFRGETPWDCTLSDGPVRDFNVMVRRGRSVEVTRRGAGRVVAGSFVLAGAEGAQLGPTTLAPFDLARCTAGEGLDAPPDGVIEVRLGPE